jgi:tripartite-type tricarboxylate transporter receptor subunit TctC
MSGFTRRSVVAGGLSALAATPARSEQGWPDRPITMVHGFPPGGTVDLVTRIVADGLAKRLRQPVVVEGRPGASGITATGQVARAAPNGYTLLVIPSGHAVIAATFKSLPYRAIDDFTAIAMAVEYPYVLVTYSVDRLNAEVTSVLQEPVSVERLRAIGAEPMLSTPEQLKARMIADIAKWTAVADSMAFERI